MAHAAREIKELRLTSKRLQAAPASELETIIRDILCPVLLKLAVRERQARAPSCWYQLLGRCAFFRSNESLQKEQYVAAMELVNQMNDLIAFNTEWKLDGVSGGLLRLLQQNDVDTAITMRELGISIRRCPCSELRSLAGMLLTSMSTETGEHRTHLLHLTLHSVSAFSTIIEDYGGEATPVPSAFSTSKNGRAQDQRELLRFCMSVILMSYCTGDSSQSEPCTSDHVPAGLSIVDVEELSCTPPGVPLDGNPGIHKKILGVLNLCGVCDNFPLTEVALIALAASNHPNPRVSSTAEYVLDTRCSRNGVLFCDLLEDEEFILRTFELLCGSQSELPPQQAKDAAPTPLRARLYNLCAKSFTSCNIAPHILEVMRTAMEDIIDPRNHDLQYEAGKFVLWVLENANEDVVACVAKRILDGAIYALKLLPVAAPTPSPPIRRILYKAVGQIAERAPQEFKGDVTTAAGFFGKLETEMYRLSETVNDTVNRLACAYTALPSPEVNNELQHMLKWQAKSSNERARSCAMVWSVSIFPKDLGFLDLMEIYSSDRKEDREDLQTTKLMGPASSSRGSVSVNESVWRRDAYEVHRGWPEVWANMKRDGVAPGTPRALSRAVSESEVSISSELSLM